MVGKRDAVGHAFRSKIKRRSRDPRERRDRVCVPSRHARQRVPGEKRGDAGDLQNLPKR